METTLAASIQCLKGVGPKLAKVLAKKGISTLEDALYNFPRAYEDRRHLTPIGSLQPGNKATVFGRVQSSRQIRQGRQIRFEAVLVDGTGRLQLFWFRGFPSLLEEFANDELFLVHGGVESFAGIPKIVHPDYEKVKELRNGKPIASVHFGRVVPVYSETEGLHQKTIRRLMGEALKQSLALVEEPFPIEMLQRLRLPALKESFVSLHFPKDCPPDGPPAGPLSRIAFEEFFILQMGLAMRKQKRESEKASPMVDLGGLLSRFVRELPFEMTGDQKKAVREIAVDLAKSRAMTRLVQGDVGSGKTVVALAAAAVAVSAGFQSALMAPTEILAQQHLRTAQTLLGPLGVSSLLLSQATSSRSEVRRAVADGTAQVVVGTHALFSEAVRFSRLGLVIVDEQHRFGVEQRAELVRKADGLFPHVLLMTATPIPRTLALTLYGDLDMTLIQEKPANRQSVRTTVFRERDRPRVYQKIRDAVARGQQVYVIYPLVEASEKLDLKSATEMYEHFCREIFPELAVALLHGKMKAEEKDRILAEFKEGKFQVLIATTVIEVGIDVANATLMVIEHAERLGLSQLHQLRGRVGRGELTSECVLLTGDFVSPRLRVLADTQDGFQIAEEDLKFRGPGEFLGVRQSGLPGFRAGHIVQDAALVAVAREEALRILEADPALTAPEHQRIRTMVESRWKEKLERLRGS